MSPLKFNHIHSFQTSNSIGSLCQGLQIEQPWGSSLLVGIVLEFTKGGKVMFIFLSLDFRKLCDLCGCVEC